MRAILTAVLALAAAPAAAAGESFVSLTNTDFIVLLAFLLFLAILAYFGVHKQLAAMLDRRADAIRGELDEARNLREEAQALLASYERKQKDVQAQADRIVTEARADAERAAEQAKADIAASIERRLAAAQEQIAAAEAGAVREVRDRAITVALAAAREVVASDMSAADADRLIDEAIGEVDAKLH